ncbi:hypothetical protein H4R35_003865 [Dimargaris xerosporica]|nr:hypothetical protein H4R35_003865 [Dimargaris xerosporica]
MPQPRSSAGTTDGAPPLDRPPSQRSNPRPPSGRALAAAAKSKPPSGHARRTSTTDRRTPRSRPPSVHSEGPTASHAVSEGTDLSVAQQVQTLQATMPGLDLFNENIMQELVRQLREGQQRIADLETMLQERDGSPTTVNSHATLLPTTTLEPPVPPLRKRRSASLSSPVRPADSMALPIERRASENAVALLNSDATPSIDNRAELEFAMRDVAEEFAVLKREIRSMGPHLRPFTTTARRGLSDSGSGLGSARSALGRKDGLSELLDALAKQKTEPLLNPLGASPSFGGVSYEPAAWCEELQLGATIGKVFLLQIRELQSRLYDAEQTAQSQDEHATKCVQELDQARKQNLRLTEELDAMAKKNWDLEVVNQEQTDEIKALKKAVNRSVKEANDLQKTLATTTETMEQLRCTEERLQQSLEANRTRHEQDMLQTRRKLVTLQRDNNDLARKYKEVKNDLLGKIQRMGGASARSEFISPTTAERHELDLESLAPGDEMGPPPMEQADADYPRTPARRREGSWAPGSVAPASAQSLHVQTLTGSLAHYQQKVETLRAARHREKQEKLEYKAALENAQEVIEGLEQKLALVASGAVDGIDQSELAWRDAEDDDNILTERQRRRPATTKPPRTRRMLSRTPKARVRVRGARRSLTASSGPAAQDDVFGPSDPAHTSHRASLRSLCSRPSLPPAHAGSQPDDSLASELSRLDAHMDPSLLAANPTQLRDALLQSGGTPHSSLLADSDGDSGDAFTDVEAEESELRTRAQRSPSASGARLRPSKGGARHRQSHLRQRPSPGAGPQQIPQSLSDILGGQPPSPPADDGSPLAHRALVTDQPAVLTPMGEIPESPLSPLAAPRPMLTPPAPGSQCSLCHTIYQPPLPRIDAMVQTVERSLHTTGTDAPIASLLCSAAVMTETVTLVDAAVEPRAAPAVVETACQTDATMGRAETGTSIQVVTVSRAVQPEPPHPLGDQETQTDASPASESAGRALYDVDRGSAALAPLVAHASTAPILPDLASTGIDPLPLPVGMDRSTTTDAPVVHHAYAATPMLSTAHKATAPREAPTRDAATHPAPTRPTLHASTSPEHAVSHEVGIDPRPLTTHDASTAPIAGHAQDPAMPETLALDMPFGDQGPPTTPETAAFADYRFPAPTPDAQLLHAGPVATQPIQPVSPDTASAPATKASFAVQATPVTISDELPSGQRPSAFNRPGPIIELNSPTTASPTFGSPSLRLVCSNCHCTNVVPWSGSLDNLAGIPELDLQARAGTHPSTANNARSGVARPYRPRRRSDGFITAMYGRAPAQTVIRSRAVPATTHADFAGDTSDLSAGLALEKNPALRQLHPQASFASSTTTNTTFTSQSSLPPEETALAQGRAAGRRHPSYGTVANVQTVVYQSSSASHSHRSLHDAGSYRSEDSRSPRLAGVVRPHPSLAAPPLPPRPTTPPPPALLAKSRAWQQYLDHELLPPVPDLPRATQDDSALPALRSSRPPGVDQRPPLPPHAGRTLRAYGSLNNVGQAVTQPLNVPTHPAVIEHPEDCPPLSLDQVLCSKVTCESPPAPGSQTPDGLRRTDRAPLALAHRPMFRAKSAQAVGADEEPEPTKASPHRLRPTSAQLRPQLGRQQSHVMFSDHVAPNGGPTTAPAHLPEPLGGPMLLKADPLIIHAITQTMVGEFMWKSTRHKGSGMMKERRHLRFFWIHPYTKTIHWSRKAPGADGGFLYSRMMAKSKSAYLKAVRVVADYHCTRDNDVSPFSFVVQTADRELKFKAINRIRHDIWHQALAYLQTRPVISANTMPRHSVFSQSHRDKAQILAHPHANATTVSMTVPPQPPVVYESTGLPLADGPGAPVDPADSSETSSRGRSTPSIFKKSSYSYLLQKLSPYHPSQPERSPRSPDDVESSPPPPRGSDGRWLKRASAAPVVGSSASSEGAPGTLAHSRSKRSFLSPPIMQALVPRRHSSMALDNVITTRVDPGSQSLRAPTSTHPHHRSETFIAPPSLGELFPSKSRIVVHPPDASRPGPSNPRLCAEPVTTNASAPPRSQSTDSAVDVASDAHPGSLSVQLEEEKTTTSRQTTPRRGFIAALFHGTSPPLAPTEDASFAATADSLVSKGKHPITLEGTDEMHPALTTDLMASVTPSWLLLWEVEYVGPSLYARLKRELKQSMREKTQPKLTVIRSVLSDITYAEKANLMKHPNLSAEANKAQAQTDGTIVSLIQAAQKKRRDAIALYQSQQREDLAAKERAELAVLCEFLPEPYSASEVEALVRAAIQSTQAGSVKDLGRVIQAIAADPARVTKAQLAQTAKQLLAAP